MTDVGHPVKLYVYDLSHGMAKSMSLMLTGKQIDGIWHTSVVVYGREIFFGQGILEAKPGTTHHGQPLQIIDCGSTMINEDTFNDYIESLQEMYTPDKYHLMDFNCNHFTADVVGFLSGAVIPTWISGLPAEFLSTPFGQAMRPQIDAMFRRTTASEHRVNSSTPAPPSSAAPSGTATPSGSLGSSLLNSVAASATANPPAGPVPSKRTAPTSPLTLVSSSANFQSILSQHPAVVVNFTNTPGCPPCRVIKPIYESIAANHTDTYGSKGARFVEVELGVGEGRDIASRYGVSATPTFMFFRHGKKVDELKGASKRELEGKIEVFLEETWPRHPHRKVFLPQLSGIPTNPITSATIPNYTALTGKLETFGASSSNIQTLKDKVVPILEAKTTPSEDQLSAGLAIWTESSSALLKQLKPEETFPIIDLWRVGLLNASIASLLALKFSSLDPISPILALASSTLTAQGTSTPKPFLLTTLRLLTNLLASLPLANIFLGGSNHDTLIAITVESLLHADTSVRSAAAGVAVNLASWRHRLAKERSIPTEDEDEPEWEVELVSALIEGIGRETDEDVAHRLLAALGLAVYLSPGYEASLKPLLEVLDAKKVIVGKISSWKKKEVKKLAEDIAYKVC